MRVVILFAVTALGSGCGQTHTSARTSRGHAADAAPNQRIATETAVVTAPDVPSPRSPESEEPRKPNQVSDAPTVDQEAFDSGLDLYEANCAVCHGKIAQSTKRNRSPEEITQAILDVGNMKFLETLVDAEIAAISLALSDEAAEVLGVDGDLALAGTPPGQLVSQLSTRQFFASQVKAVFSVPGAEVSKDWLNQYVLNQTAAFGGPCRVYDAGCQTSSAADRLTRQDASMQPVPNPSRAGFQIQICEKVLQNDGYVRNALANAAIVESAAIDAASLTKLYDLFVPGHTPTKDLENALGAVAKSLKDQNVASVDQWRFVMLPLCTSSAFALL